MNSVEYLETPGDLKKMSLEMIAATITHEIKNPLALIKANIDFIELCDTEKKYKKNYASMKREIDRANEILCNLGKCLQDGFSGFDMYENVDICRIIDEVIQKYIHNKRIVIDLDADSRPLTQGNRELLSMALSNVIKNAVEAVEGNDIGRIRVSVRQDRNTITITVTDNGCGLDEDTLAKLNDDTFITTKKYGNGLGINITKKIIMLHNGGYSIGNNSSGGAKVEIWLK